MRAEPPSVSEPRILQGHVNKRSFEFIGKSQSRDVIILPSLFAIGTLAIEIYKGCFCPVTLQDHVVNVLYNFMIISLTRCITILASLVAIDTVLVQI